MMKIDFTVSENNLCIKDSYKIEGEIEMRKILLAFKKELNEEDCKPIHQRSIDNLVEEWKAHNLLYILHLFRTHTKDVDLDTNGKKYQIIWKVLSWFYG